VSKDRRVQLDTFCISGIEGYELLASCFRYLNPKNKLYVYSEQELLGSITQSGRSNWYTAYIHCYTIQHTVVSVYTRYEISLSFR